MQADLSGESVYASCPDIVVEMEKVVESLDQGMGLDLKAQSAEMI